MLKAAPRNSKGQFICQYSLSAVKTIEAELLKGATQDQAARAAGLGGVEKNCGGALISAWKKTKPGFAKIVNDAKEKFAEKVHNKFVKMLKDGSTIIEAFAACRTGSYRRGLQRRLFNFRKENKPVPSGPRKGQTQRDWKEIYPERYAEIIEAIEIGLSKRETSITCGECNEEFSHIVKNTGTIPPSYCSENCLALATKKRLKKWNKENEEWQRARKKVYNQTKSQELKDREKQSKKNWKINNPKKVRNNSRKRQAQLLNAYIPSSNQELIDKVYDARDKMNEELGLKFPDPNSITVDHIIPLEKGGAHHQDNLRLLTFSENAAKKDEIDLSLEGVWANNTRAREIKAKLNNEKV